MNACLYVSCVHEGLWCWPADACSCSLWHVFACDYFDRLSTRCEEQISQVRTVTSNVLRVFAQLLKETKWTRTSDEHRLGDRSFCYTVAGPRFWNTASGTPSAGHWTCYISAAAKTHLFKYSSSTTTVRLLYCYKLTTHITAARLSRHGLLVLSQRHDLLRPIRI